MQHAASDATSSDAATSEDETTFDGPACGDGAVDDGEECDDANAVDGDGCNSDCRESGRELWSFDDDEGAPRRIVSFAADAEGMVYVAGSEQVNTESAAPWIAKFDQSGNQQWEYLAEPGPIEWTYISGLRVRPDGRVVATEYRPFAQILELDADGVVVYKELIDGFVDDLVITTDAIFVCGQKDFEDSGFDAIVARYGADGELVWQEVFAGAAGLDDAAYGIELTPSGTLVVGGNADGLYEMDPSSSWIASYDADGALLWDVVDDGAGEDRQIWDIDVSDDGSIVASGQITEVDGVPKLFLVGYDADGTLAWERVSSEQDAGYDIAALPDGGLAVVSTVATNEHDGWLGRFDGEGQLLWSTSVDGSVHGWDYGAGLDVLPSGDIVAVFGIDHEDDDWVDAYPRVTAYTP